jgi:hypothetical protein
VAYNLMHPPGPNPRSDKDQKGATQSLPKWSVGRSLANSARLRILLTLSFAALSIFVKFHCLSESTPPAQHIISPTNQETVQVIHPPKKNLEPNSKKGYS